MKCEDDFIKPKAHKELCALWKGKLSLSGCQFIFDALSKQTLPACQSPVILNDPKDLPLGRTGYYDFSHLAPPVFVHFQAGNLGKELIQFF